MNATRSQLALRYIKQKMQRGELPPGSRLSDFALADEIGVSRGPIREAIQALVTEGVAEARPHVGTFVKSLTREELRELYEFREILESFAAGRVSERRDELPDAIRLLRDTVETLREIEAKADANGWDELPKAESAQHQEANLTFHQTIVNAAGNRRVAEAVNSSALHVRLFGSLPARMPMNRAFKTQSCHHEVLEAIERQNPDAARDAMARHIRYGLEVRLAHWSEDTQSSKMERYFDGLVDEVPIYDYDLGENKVLEHFNAAIPEPRAALADRATETHPVGESAL